MRICSRYPGIAVLVLLLVAISLPVCAETAAGGNLSGLVQDEAGNPLADVLVTLLPKPRPAAPILARTDQAGRILLQNLKVGLYEILVKTPAYLSSQNNSRVEILPGRTAMVTLVLQSLFQFNPSDQQSVTVKTLLRTISDRRLIFRQMPGFEEESESRPSPFFDNLVFQVYTNAGLDGDFLVFPSDSSGGATTNFALVDSRRGGGSYIFAGQMGSGENSLWRFKNFFTQRLSDKHSLDVFLGYGRMSFEQSSLAVLGNPAALGEVPGYMKAPASTRILTLGFEDQWQWSPQLSMIWGLELNQVRNLSSHSFANPSAQLVYTPAEDTTVRLMLASKRLTQANTLDLPNGGNVSLGDAVYFSRIGDQFRIGTARYHRASISQKLGEKTEVELATFQDQISGGGLPLLAVWQYDPQAEVRHLEDSEADSRGYRWSVRREINERASASVSYVTGRASSLDNGDLTVVLDPAALQTLLDERQFHAFAYQLDGFLPRFGTRITALLKLVANGRPITTLDRFADVYDTANSGVNIFIRQIVPVPTGILSVFGLEFPAYYRVEALLDIRNLTNEDLGLLRTALGDVLLVRSPRTVRGGVAVRF